MKNLFAIIIIVSSINCSFLRELTGTGFTVSEATLNKQCINLGSDDEATLTFTVSNVGEEAGTSLNATFTLEGSDSTTIETKCNTSGEGSVNFTCKLSGDGFTSPGNYKLKTINDTDVSTLTSSLKVAQKYELGAQTPSQTINEESKSFEIVFKGELKDKLVPQIFATANSESSIQGCSKNANTVECTPTTSEMPVGTYTIHYLNGCNKELTSTGVTVEVSSSGTGSGTGTGSGSGTGAGTGSGTGAGTGTGNGTSTGNGTETNSESKSVFITLSTLTLFVFGILF